MRVHIGSDHAGLELKDHLVGWLADQGHEAVDHGPFVYDALDDYPVFCLRAAEAVAADGHDGVEALGVVIGGSGNGEQIAANKVVGVRAALVWSEETAVLAREHNDANVVAVGGRMHTLEDMTRFVEVFLAHGVLRRRAAHPPHRDAHRLREDAEPAPAAGLRPGRSAGRGRAMPEGHTLRRLADDLTAAFGGRTVAVSSPQGRFGAEAALLDGSTLLRADAAGKHLFVELEGDHVVHVHLGLIGTFRIVTGDPTPPVGQVRLRLVARRATARGTTYADLRGAITCALITPEQQAAVVARLGPDPLRPDADPGPGVGADLAQPAQHRRPADGPGGDGRASATSTAPRRCSGSASHPFRPGTSVRRGRFEALWADLVELMAEGVRTNRIDTVRPEHTPEAMGRDPRRDDHGGEVYVYRRHEQPCLRVRHPDPHPRAGRSQRVLVPALPAHLPLPRPATRR